MFHIQGSGISNVDIAIDKGELYSARIDKTTEEALRDWHFYVFKKNVSLIFFHIIFSFHSLCNSLLRVSPFRAEVRNFGSKNPNLSLTNNDDESDLQKDEKIKAPFPDFSITAYAAELDIAEPGDGNIIFLLIIHIPL